MLDGIHIRCCGHGGLGFRPYGGSLWKIRKPAQSKVTKTLRPPLGASLRLGMPERRH